MVNPWEISDVARRYDPVTSHQAGVEVTQSGLRQSQADKICSVLEQCPGGLTNGELEELLPEMTSAQIFRRAPELERHLRAHRRYAAFGRLVTRRYKGYNQQVWFPGPADPVQITLFEGS